MPKCAFCGDQVDKGRGKMFVYNSGKIDFFCSSKCEKNMIGLKRKPLQTRWTKRYHEEHKRSGAEGIKKQLQQEKELEQKAKKAAAQTAETKEE